MTHNYLLSLNAWLLLYPSSLCADWTMGSVPLIETIGDSRNIATIIFYTFFFLLSYKAIFLKDRVLTLSLSLIVFPFLPASNLFFPVGFVIAERVLYLPSAGYSLIVALGISGFERYFTQKWLKMNFLNSMIVLLVIAHSSKTVLRNRDWYNERDLFVSGLSVNPNNAKLYNNVGHTYEIEGKPEAALKYYLQAIEIQKDDLGAHMNAGRMFAKLNRKREAESHFRSAEMLIPTSRDGSGRTRIAPDHLMLFLHWAKLISKDHKRLKEAEKLLRRVTKMRPEFVDSWINLGEVLLVQNRTKDAEKVYKTALSLDRKNPDIHYNVSLDVFFLFSINKILNFQLGVVAIQTGNLETAIGHFEKALQLFPNHQVSFLLVFFIRKLTLF